MISDSESATSKTLNPCNAGCILTIKTFIFAIIKSVFQNLKIWTRCQCRTCPFDTDILDNAFGGVWPDFGGGGSPNQLAPRSGQFSSLGFNTGVPLYKFLLTVSLIFLTYLYKIYAWPIRNHQIKLSPVQQTSKWK